MMVATANSNPLSPEHTQNISFVSSNTCAEKKAILLMTISLLKFNNLVLTAMVAQP